MSMSIQPTTGVAGPGRAKLTLALATLGFPPDI
jgi:hypothetical protein